jgi:hypothetical protein
LVSHKNPNIFSNYLQAQSRSENDDEISAELIFKRLNLTLLTEKSSNSSPPIKEARTTTTTRHNLPTAAIETSLNVTTTPSSTLYFRSNKAQPNKNNSSETQIKPTKKSYSFFTNLIACVINFIDTKKKSNKHFDSCLDRYLNDNENYLDLMKKSFYLLIAIISLFLLMILFFCILCYCSKLKRSKNINIYQKFMANNAQLSEHADLKQSKYENKTIVTRIRHLNDKELTRSETDESNVTNTFVKETNEQERNACETNDGNRSLTTNTNLPDTMNIKESSICTTPIASSDLVASPLPADKEVTASFEKKKRKIFCLSFPSRFEKKSKLNTHSCSNDENTHL